MTLDAVKKELVAEVNRDISDIVKVLGEECASYEDARELLDEHIDRLTWMESEDNAREAIAFHPTATAAMHFSYDAGTIFPEHNTYRSGTLFFWRRVTRSLLWMLAEDGLQTHFDQQEVTQ